MLPLGHEALTADTQRLQGQYEQLVMILCRQILLAENNRPLVTMPQKQVMSMLTQHLVLLL